jgi:ceramide glucosyltransferase
MVPEIIIYISFTLWTLFFLIQCVWGTFLTIKHLSSNIIQKDNTSQICISILKPLKGIDTHLSENLKSFFDINYPESCFELIFSVANSSDPAIDVVKELISKRQNIQAKLIIGERCVGLSPKFNNLVIPVEQAKYKYLLFSDSNVIVPPDYIHCLIKCLNSRKIGIVSAIVGPYSPECLSSGIESAFLCSYMMRSFMLFYTYYKTPPMGKTMLFNKDTFTKIGGVAYLSKFHGEEYAAAKAIENFGMITGLCNKPVYQYMGISNFSDICDRHIRWGVVRKQTLPFPVFMEFFYRCTGCLFLLWIFSPKEYFLYIFLIQIVVWITCDYQLYIISGNHHTIKFIMWWCISEVLHIYILIRILLTNTVMWRGESFYFGEKGLIEQRKNE